LVNQNTVHRGNDRLEDDSNIQSLQEMDSSNTVIDAAVTALETDEHRNTVWKGGFPYTN